MTIQNDTNEIMAIDLVALVKARRSLPITANMVTADGGAEASSLGLQPGIFPARFFVDGVGTFLLDRIMDGGHHVYRHMSSAQVFTIWND